MKTVYVLYKVGHLLRKVYSIKDAAQALGLHPKTLRRWEEKGKFTPLRTLGNQRRFTDKDLNLLAKLKAGEPIPPPAIRVLTLDQAAQKLNVSSATIQRWTKAGKLKLSVNDQLEPGYNENEIRQLLQGPTLKVPEGKTASEEPSRSDLVGKPTRSDLIVRYSGLAGLALALGIIAYIFLNQQKGPASPVVLETQTPTIDVALPRTAQFLDGRITLGLDTGDLFYADSTGNLYLKNSALIDQGVFTHNLQLLPTSKPQENQIGQIYVDQGSGNLKYFDGLDWIDLNRSASQSTTINQLSNNNDITLGDLNASASAESLRITLAGDQSVVKVLGGANQDIVTLNDDALYPIILSQPTQILGNLLAPKLIDQDQSGYFLDPSSTTISLSVAGEATISSTLKFSKNNEYITNSIDDYLIFSGGIGIGGNSSYGFSSNQKLNARAANVEDDLTVEHLRLTDNKIESIDANGLALYDDNSHGIVIKDGGFVGIGTTSPSQQLEVVGSILVTGGSFIDDGTTLTVPDYVFEPNYELLSPVDLKEYVSLHQHLPGVPSRTEIKVSGLNLSQMMLAILEKTEENTLYILDLYDRSNRIISPTVETEVLTTSMISPLTDGQITISGNASVSGTLFASQIESSTIDRLRAKISQLADNLSHTPGVIEVSTPGVEESAVATAAAILDNRPPATDSGHLALTDLEADAAFFKDYLAVLGQTTLTDVKINNSLNVIGAVNLSGGLTIAGPLTVSQINTLPEQELSINIASGSALSIYSEISPLATFSGKTVSLANLKLEASGTATVSAGTNNSQISTDRLTGESQVIVTFTSDYTPATKYWVKKDSAAKAFTIFTNYPVNNDTTLDWLIIN